MNKYLRQIFTAVIVLFTILGLSTTIITAIKANTLNADSRNTRALYREIGAPRGSILAADGTVLAKSDPASDSFKYQRIYSNGPLYAPVTGYFSVNQRAQQGVEKSRNQLLSGNSDSLFWQRVMSVLSGSENKGASVETSIDTKLQQAAYMMLDGREGAVVAIEPSTGRVLALVSTPSYDPNRLASHDTAKANTNYRQLVTDKANPMLNRTASELYPPGSTFKTVVAAAALESGKYQPDTQIPAGASYTLPGTATNLTNTTSAAAGSNGQISLSDAIAYSSNTAMAQLGVALGGKAISDQATKLGFGSTITIDSSTGSQSMTSVASKFPSSTTDDKLALASIGQGDTLETPLQNAMIASAIANDGKLMQPTLVDRVRASDLSVLSTTTPHVLSDAFSADTADKLTGMMQAVVTKDAPTLSIPGVNVAAKTGTAQIGMSNSSTDAWVMGFAPAEDPKIAVAVVVHNANDFGVTAAGPIFHEIIREALQQ